jgi:hypothetical protein
VSEGLSPRCGHIGSKSSTGYTANRISNTNEACSCHSCASATITIEQTQAFADGNRIHTSDNSTLCRDRRDLKWRAGNGLFTSLSSTGLIGILCSFAVFARVREVRSPIQNDTFQL